MKVRYTGDQPTEHTGEHGTGLWTPGEVREVSDEVAAELIAGGGWVGEKKARKGQEA